MTGIPAVIDTARLGVAELNHNNSAINAAKNRLANNVPQFLPISLAEGVKPFAQSVASTIATPYANAKANEAEAYAHRILDPAYAPWKGGQNYANIDALNARQGLQTAPLNMAGFDVNDKNVTRKVLGQAGTTGTNILMAGELPGVTGSLKSTLPTFGGLGAVQGVAGVAQQDNPTGMDYLKGGAGSAIQMMALPLLLKGGSVALKKGVPPLVQNANEAKLQAKLNPELGAVGRDVNKGVGETPIAKSERLHQEKLTKNNLTQNEYAGLHQNVTDLERAASQAHSIVNDAVASAPRDATGKFTPAAQAQLKQLTDNWTKALDDHVNALNVVRKIDGQPLIDTGKTPTAKPTVKVRENPPTPVTQPIGVGKNVTGKVRVTGSGVEKTVTKIMKDEGLTREQATVRMDDLLRRDLAQGQTVDLGAVPNKPLIKVTGKPAKNPQVKELLSTASKANGASSVEGSIVAADIATKAKQLGVKLDQGFTDRYQAGALQGSAEKQLGSHIKGITDKLFVKEQGLDPTIKYRENYVPQSYAQSAEEVAAATNKLQKQTGAANPRKFNTYQEAGQFGLTPKHGTIDTMIGESASRAENVTQNRKLVNQGLEGGLFSTDPKGGTPVAGITDKTGNQIYAQKSVADTMNGVLQRDSMGLAKALHTTAKAFEVNQDVMLQGGIPGTNANFFVAGQAVKDTTRNIGKAPLHPIQAIKQEGHLIGDFFRGKMKTQERFSNGSFKANGNTVKNADFVRDLANEGLYIQPQTSMSGVGKGSIQRGWNTLGNSPTFGRYMPNRLLSTAQEVYSQSVGKLGHEGAVKLAAETTKTFTGQVDTILKGRSNLTNDVNSVAFFAPKYRESIIGALNNVVKSTYPKNWADPKFAPSRQLLAGMIVTLAGYEALNRKLTGHSMMENRQGQELSVEIPYGDKDEKGNQKVINVPFMPGFMTIPRAIGSAVTNRSVKNVVAQSSKALSAPFQTAGNVVANRDYFGRPIYNDQATADQEGINPDNAAQVAGKVGVYVGGQGSPAWVRGVIDKASGKPTEQAIATAIEAPVRFGKRINPETATYFKDRDQIYGKLDKNNKAAWDTIHPKLKNVNGEYMTDPTVDSPLARAAVTLDRPDVLAAENEMARRARSRGQKADPLYELDGQSQRVALRIQTLPPKDPQKAKLIKDNPWYEDLTTAREKFFSSLPPGDPNKPKSPIEFPKPTPEIASLKKAYYQIEDPKMAHQFLKNNPDVTDQMAKEEQYSRAVRAAKDLPQYDKYPDATPAVNKLMDEYNALPQKESGGKSRIRSAWIKSHPNEWATITDQYSKVAQFNLQNDAEMANFEGENLTEKGIKSIASLAKDLGLSGDGGYGGYGSSGRKSNYAQKYSPSQYINTAKVSAPPKQFKGVKVAKVTAKARNYAGGGKIRVSSRKVRVA